MTTTIIHSKAGTVLSDARLGSMIQYAAGEHFFELSPVEVGNPLVKIGLTSSDALMLAAALINSVRNSDHAA